MNPLSRQAYLTEEEYEQLGRDTTQRELRKLFLTNQNASFKFQKWLVENHQHLGRTTLSPIEVADEIEDDELDETNSQLDDSSDV